MDFLIEKMLIPLLIIGMGLCLFMVGLLLYRQFVSDKIVLLKDEWKCTETVEHDWLQPTMIGKATVLLPMHETVCVNYKKL